MGFSKKIRKAVFDKTDGHCAYCGCVLPPRWHVDHIVPKRRSSTEESLKNNHEERGGDNLENLLPACPSCNIFKDTQSLESFRKSIEHTYDTVLLGTKTISIAERYGIVTRQRIKVKFYFEKLKEAKIENDKKCN